jgi:hypothetical protein
MRRAGDTFELKVNIVRGDYKEAVALAVEGIENLTVTNNVIGAGKTNVTMKVQLPASIEPAIPRHITVFGQARNRADAPRVKASTAPALRRMSPQMLYALPEFDESVAVGVKAAPPK